MPIRELRNNGGDVADRVLAGEDVTVTRAGKPIMRLVPLPPPALNSEALLRQWKNLPAVDYQQFRQDLSAVFDDAV